MQHPEDFEYDGYLNCKNESNTEHQMLLGVERPDRQWVCTDFDVWMKNPYYVGPDQGHPEDDR